MVSTVNVVSDLWSSTRSNFSPSPEGTCFLLLLSPSFLYAFVRPCPSPSPVFDAGEMGRLSPILFLVSRATLGNR